MICAGPTSFPGQPQFGRTTAVGITQSMDMSLREMPPFWQMDGAISPHTKHAWK